MIGEFIKILADEPEKFEKVFLRIYKGLLAIVFSIVIYKFVFHSAPDFRLNTKEQIEEFILKGKFVIYTLFYVTAYFILFSILEVFFSWIAFSFVSRYHYRPTNIELGIFLKSAGALTIEKNGKHAKTGRNFQAFNELFRMYGDKNERSQIDSLKGSNVDNLWSLGCVTFFVYLVSGIYSFWPTKIIYITIFVLAGILLLLYFIYGLLEYLKDNHKQLSFTFQGISAYESVLQLLKEKSIAVTINRKWGSCSFSMNDTKYLLQFLYTEHEIFFDEVRKYVEAKQKESNQFFIFISNLPFIGQPSPLDLLYLDTIVYENEDDLEGKFTRFLHVHGRKKK